MMFRNCMVIGLLSAFSAIAASDEPTSASSICVVNADGSQLKTIHQEAGRFYGSPSWSHDDQAIAFDSWSGSERNYRHSEVMTCKSDGSALESLGPGAMPCWSPDDQRIAYHSYEQGFAISVFTRDGSEGQVISDSGGSPRWVARTPWISFGTRGNIALFNLETEKERMLFNQPPMSIYYGFAWSPDGKRVAFPTIVDGRQPDAVAIAEFHTDKLTQQATVRYKGTDVFTAIDWSPDGKHLLLSVRDKPQSPYQLHTIEVDSKKKPQRLEWQADDRDNTSGNWAHNGKQIVFISKAATVQQ